MKASSSIANQKRFKESLQNEKREILEKLKKLEEDELYLDEEMYNVLSQIQEIIQLQNTPDSNPQVSTSFDG